MKICSQKQQEDTNNILHGSHFVEYGQNVFFPKKNSNYAQRPKKDYKLVCYFEVKLGCRAQRSTIIINQNMMNTISKILK